MDDALGLRWNDAFVHNITAAMAFLFFTYSHFWRGSGERVHYSMTSEPPGTAGQNLMKTMFRTKVPQRSFICDELPFGAVFLTSRLEKLHSVLHRKAFPQTL